MKLFITALLLSVTSLSCCVFPIEAKMICTRPNCKNYVTSNKAIVIFDGLSMNFAHDGRKYDVNMYCEIENNTGDTLLFDRKSFLLHAAKTTFVSTRFYHWNGKKNEELPDVFRVPPGTMPYNLNFTSKKGMSEREYHKRIFTDTVTLFYRNQQQTDTVFKMTIEDNYKDRYQRALLQDTGKTTH